VEDALRKQIAVDLDPNLRNLPVVLTEFGGSSGYNGEIGREALVETALRTRPDLRANMQQIDVDDLSLRGTKNALRPNLLFGGGYTSTAAAAPSTRSKTSSRATGPPIP